MQMTVGVGEIDRGRRVACGGLLTFVASAKDCETEV